MTIIFWDVNIVREMEEQIYEEMISLKSAIIKMYTILWEKWASLLRIKEAV